jgi:hypothetical protein
MKNLLLLFLSFLFLLGCQKEDLPTIGGGLTMLSVDPVTALLGGQVSNEEGIPLAGAKIIVGTEESTTDANGFFLFSSLEMNQAGTAVQVRKEGFFNYVTWIYPSAASQNFVNVNLLRREIAASFMASEGIVFDLEDARIELPAAGYVNATGQPYTGRVEVAARWLDATDPTHLNSLAGSSMGLTEEGDYQSLLQTGTLMLELLTSTGEKLALAENVTAKLRLPVAEQWRGGVTSERPMWYLDEEQGIWIQDGNASWKGDYYEAEVSHFTFWCCCPPFPPVNLKGRLLTADNEPIVQRVVSMEVVNTGLLQGGVLTNGIGRFSGFAPEGEELRMVVWNACGEEAYSENIGSHTMTTDLGTFVLTNEYYFRFTGQALDCNFEPLPNAFVTVRWNDYDRTYIADNEGNYAAGLYLCTDSGGPAPFELRLADINTGFVSPWLEQELMHDMDFSIQLACTTPEEDFIEVNCAGETRVFLTPYVGPDYSVDQLVIGDSLFVAGQGGAPTEVVFFVEGDLFPSPEEPLTCIEVVYRFATISGDLFNMGCSFSCENFNLTITENEGPGGYVAGIFSGVLANFSSNNEETPLNGRFRVRQP